eukprot:gene16741-19901_t
MVSKSKFLVTIIIAIALAIGLIVALAVLIPKARDNNNKDDSFEHVVTKRNVIFMVADGFGPAAATLARVAKKTMDKTQPMGLTIDNYLSGTVRTYSGDSWVTDSAAGATAYASGVKTYNNAVGVNMNKTAVGTMFEAAQTKGLKTGLVFTTRVSDATPAAFYSHSTTRKNEYFITSQLWDKNISVVLGGGGMYYKDVVNNAKLHNYTLVNNKTEMMKVENGKVLGIFSDYDMPMELDRRTFGMTEIPTLKEMTVKALDLIDQDNEKGFMLMIEGSQIDLAAHGNDASAAIYEVLAFDEAVKAVMDFAEKDGNTIVIITADHETGGLTLANQVNTLEYPVYVWSPEILLSINCSTTTMADLISKKIADTKADPSQFPTIIDTIVKQYSNLPAGKELTTDELTELSKYTDDVWTLYWVLGKMLSAKATVGWTTSGHTGVDVNLYYYYADYNDQYIYPLVGNMENIDLAHYVEKALDLDLAFETSKLVNFNTTGTK